MFVKKVIVIMNLGDSGRLLTAPEFFAFIETLAFGSKCKECATNDFLPQSLLSFEVPLKNKTWRGADIKGIV